MNRTPLLGATPRRIFLWITSAIGAVVGAWAAFAPLGFYEAFPGLGLGPWVGVDGPYNEHLVRDVGALYLALAAAGIYAALATGVQAGRAVGIAWIVFSLPHLAYHLRHLEGLDPLNAAAEIVSLSSTIILAIPLLLPGRATPTTPWAAIPPTSAGATVPAVTALSATPVLDTTTVPAVTTAVPATTEVPANTAVPASTEVPATTAVPYTTSPAAEQR